MTKQNLWTSEDAAAATGGIVSAAFAGTGVSIDTRSLQKGDIFVALKGEIADGHDYLAKAFANGAAAAVVSKNFKGADPAWPLLYVDDTSKALEELGRAARKRSKAKIIGVAGSVGKTGTKEMLAALFGALGPTHASKKSFNNHLGVPLTLANLPPDAAFGVIEIGMNHPGEIIHLSDQAKPDISIITTIDKEHIEFFPNGLDGVADANAEIFTGMPKNGIAVLNADNSHFARLKNSAAAAGITNIIRFGEEDADSRLIDCTLHPASSKVTAEVMGEKVSFTLNIPGQHIVMNALGALAVVKAAGGNLQKAVKAFETLTPFEGRGNTHSITIVEGQPPIIVIDESYNANPGSMQATFKVLEMSEPKAGGRRIAVLGDMLELGRDGPKLHAELANPLLLAKTDLLFCCGPLMDALYQSIPEGWRGGHTKDSKQLADLVGAAVQPGDVILVKGSAGSKMAYVIETLKKMSVPAARNGNNKDIKNAL